MYLFILSLIILFYIPVFLVLWYWSLYNWPLPFLQRTARRSSTEWFRIPHRHVICFLPGICENDGTPDVHPHHPEDLDVDWFIQVAQSKKLKAAHHAAGRKHVTVLTDEVLRKKDAEWVRCSLIKKAKNNAFNFPHRQRFSRNSSRKIKWEQNYIIVDRSNLFLCSRLLIKT